MPTYTYKARDATGKRVKGRMVAASKDELASKLRHLGYMASGVSEALPGMRLELLSDLFRRVRSDDMIVFIVQLSNMINAGLTLLSSLDILGKQTENKHLKETVAEVARSVEAGESFSEALAHHPKIFSKLVVNLVKAGEASGKLDLILRRLALFMEQQAELKQKIQGATFYPAILLVAGVTVTLFLVTFIVPQFATIFLKAGIPLPLPTRILYQVGTGLKQFWFLVPIVLALAWLLVRALAKTQGGRLLIDRSKLRMPVTGSLYRKVAISRFARTLGMLVGAGVPILTSLDIVREVIGNEVLARVIASVRAAVERGEKIFESLRVSQEFPLDTVQMISVGEETGNLDEMLSKIADFYDMAVGFAVKKLITLIEPAFLVVLGSLVGLIMASMLLPIFDMIKVLRAARA